MKKEITNNLNQLLYNGFINDYKIEQVDVKSYNIRIKHEINRVIFFIECSYVEEFCLINIEYFKNILKEQMIINYKRYLAMK